MGKVTSRTALTVAADGDILHVVDVSDTTDSPQGTSKKSTLRVIRKAMGDIYEASLTIPTASVLTLNATPIEIIAAPGSGKMIRVISAEYKLTYNSIAYATNTTLQLKTSGASVVQVESTSSALAATVTQSAALFGTGTPSVGQTQLLENAGVNVMVATGNPTAGNSDIKVFVFYRIITL